jgi:hypothetical protein
MVLITTSAATSAAAEKEPVIPSRVTIKVLIPPKVDTPATSQGALPMILKRTADYSERLKREVFHFLCEERVVESSGLEVRRPRNQYSSNRLLRKSMTSLDRRALNERIKKETIKSKRRYVNHYQIIKGAGGIKEKRELTKYNGKKISKKAKKPKAFSLIYSYENALHPIYLFAPENQAQFQYKLLGKTRAMKRNAYVVEIKKTRIMAVVWIDDQDFSVLKFQVYPAAFRGYNTILRAGKGKISEIKVQDIHYFGHKHRGLRFPSKTDIIVAYIRQMQKLTPDKQVPAPIEYHARLHTTFNYKKYIFFEVKVGDPIFR